MKKGNELVKELREYLVHQRHTKYELSLILRGVIDCKKGKLTPIPIKELYYGMDYGFYFKCEDIELAIHYLPTRTKEMYVTEIYSI